MNENQEYNSENIKPYKATGNLNTAIGNPSVNINDTMNINIQNMSTNTVNTTSSQNNQNSMPLSSLQMPMNNGIPVNNSVSLNNNISTNNIATNITNTPVSSQPVNNQNNSFVKKTYVTTDNKPKKKNISLHFGSEFKIVLLIMVILLVFVFLLPVISDMFGGY